MEGCFTWWLQPFRNTLYFWSCTHSLLKYAKISAWVTWVFCSLHKLRSCFSDDKTHMASIFHWPRTHLYIISEWNDCIHLDCLTLIAMFWYWWVSDIHLTQLRFFTHQINTRVTSTWYILMDIYFSWHPVASQFQVNVRRVMHPNTDWSVCSEVLAPAVDSLHFRGRLQSRENI